MKTAYNRLLEEEYFVWTRLDGTASSSTIKSQYDRRFLPTSISHADIQNLVIKFCERNLAYSIAEGQGEQLLEARNKQRRKVWWNKLSNVFSLRFRGIDPDRFLTWLDGKAGFVFHPACIATCICIMLTAVGLLLTRTSQFIARLPSADAFFSPTGLLMLLGVLGAVKVFHELGHGLTCKHFGGECRNLGVMLLVFAPCLYCDVSDAWMFRSKWKRAAVDGAGIFVELLLASLATLIWWSTAPGLWNDLALSVMFVCTVGTLAFNANPLLRFDGYYLLSDVLEQYDLAERSRAVVRRGLGRFCLGIEYPDDPRVPETSLGWFFFYGTASFAYRWVVTIAILCFFNDFFKSHRLQSVGVFVALIFFGIPLGRTVVRWIKLVMEPGRMPKIIRSRAVATAICVSALLAALAVVPLPHRVHCNCEVVPGGEQAVFVQTPGVLVAAAAHPGDFVEAGSVLAQLENLDLRLEVERLQAQRNEYAVTAALLEKLRVTDPQVTAEIALIRESIQALDRLIAEHEADQTRLTIRAPEAGVVLPPADRRPSEPQSNVLPPWSGSPLDEQNVRSSLDVGTMLCRIGYPDRLEAQVIIEQEDIALVRVGQTVEVILDEMPGRIWLGVIEEIAEAELVVAPRRLSHAAGGELVTKRDAAGMERPRNVSYFARVGLQLEDTELLMMGLKGRARIGVGQRSVASRLSRYLHNLFQFKVG